MIQAAQNIPKPLGLCWIYCPYPVAAVGLAKILENEAHVHLGHEAPVEGSLASIIFCTDDVENLSEGIKRLQQANDSDAPILVFGLRLDLSLARAALQAGARGFIHAAMQPEQIIRALKVAKEGEIVAPRELLEYLIAEELTNAEGLSTRQREILELVHEGFTNAQIAKRLFLTESTIKQHLRAAYKVLGVSNRVEAARRMR
jgi:DNA-binding NarL/FixJ family response regulator